MFMNDCIKAVYKKATKPLIYEKPASIAAPAGLLTLTVPKIRNKYSQK